MITGWSGTRGSRGGVQWYIIMECTPASINLSCILYEMLGICKIYTCILWIV